MNVAIEIAIENAHCDCEMNVKRANQIGNMWLVLGTLHKQYKASFRCVGIFLMLCNFFRNIHY